MEEALRSHLLAHAALTALVERRIDWLKRPKRGALPAVVLQVASGPRDYTMKGRVSLTPWLVQIDVYAADYAAMKAVERAVVAALDLAMSAPLVKGFIEAQRETTEPMDGPQTAGTTAGSTDFFRSSLDVRVWSNDPS
jgi:hypothetical protein